MKKFIQLVLLCVAIQPRVIAQSTDTLPHPPQSTHVPNLCEVGFKIQTSATVRYETTAVTYLETDAIITVTCRGVADKRDYGVTRDSNILFTSLPLDQNFVLISQDSCGNEIILRNVSTYKESLDAPILLAPKFMNKLGQWAANPNGENMIAFLGNLSEVSYYERLAYFQKQLMYGQSFDDGLHIDDFPTADQIRIPEEFQSGSACNCVLGMNQGHDIERGSENVVDVLYDDVSNNYRNVYGLNNSDYTPQDRLSTWGNDDYSFDETTYEGAAKNEHLWTYGRYIHHEGDSVTNHGNNFSSLIYSYVCLNGEYYPEDCTCEIPLEVKYGYATDLEANAEVVSCFLCGSRSSYAQAEDHVILYTQDITGTYRLIDAGQASVRSSCNYEWNREF